MANQVEFINQHGITFVVRQQSDRFVYRAKARLGGPWSDVEMSMAHKHLNVSLRKQLQEAIKRCGD